MWGIIVSHRGHRDIDRKIATKTQRYKEKLDADLTTRIGHEKAQRKIDADFADLR